MENLNKVEAQLKIRKILNIDTNTSNWEEIAEPIITKYISQFLSNFNPFFPNLKHSSQNQTNMWTLLANLEIFNTVPNNIKNYIEFLNSTDVEIFIQSLYIILDNYSPKLIQSEINQIVMQLAKNKTVQPDIMIHVNICNGILTLLSNFNSINPQNQQNFDNEFIKIFELYKKRINNINPKYKEQVIKQLQFLSLFKNSKNNQILLNNSNEIIFINSISNNCIQILLNNYANILLNNKAFQHILQNMSVSEQFIEKYIQYYKNIDLECCTKYTCKNNFIIKIPCTLNFFDKYKDKIKHISINNNLFRSQLQITSLILQLKDKQKIQNILSNFERVLIDGEFISNIINKYGNDILNKFISTIKSSIDHKLGKASQIYFNNKSKNLLQNPEFIKYFDFQQYLKLKINDPNTENILFYNIKYFDKDLLMLLAENFSYSNDLLNKIINYLPLEILILKNKNLSIENKQFLKKYLKILLNELN